MQGGGGGIGLVEGTAKLGKQLLGLEKKTLDPVQVWTCVDMCVGAVGRCCAVRCGIGAVDGCWQWVLAGWVLSRT